MLEVVEYVDVNLVKLALAFEKVAETVVQIILLRELQDGFPNLLAQPYNGLADKLGSPVAWAHEPGGFAAGEKACGGLVHIETDVVVRLEKGGGTGRVLGTFGNGLHGICFFLTPGHQDNLFGAEHGGNADGYGLVRSDGDIVIEIVDLAFAGSI